jgi:hypothetical protein
MDDPQEGADEKKAKAKQDVEMLLGKNETKKSKKKKSNSALDLGVGGGGGGEAKGLNALGPPVLGGLKTGGKPLPGIANKVSLLPALFPTFSSASLVL